MHARAPRLFAAIAACALALPVSSQATRIYYDADTVPHIFGDTDADAFFGLGFQQVVDSPIMTLNMLWRNSGRMSEVAGRSYLDEDLLIRIWEVPAIAERHEDELSSSDLARLQAFVDGINEGRDWWREYADPADSDRLDDLLERVGDELKVNSDPVPDYLDQAFSPYGAFDDPDVADKIRAVVDRMFDEDYPITLDHVMRLGVVVNGGLKLLENNPVPRRVLPFGEEPELPEVDMQLRTPDTDRPEVLSKIDSPAPYEGILDVFGNDVLGDAIRGEFTFDTYPSSWLDDAWNTGQSNGWVISPDAASGLTIGLSEGHVPVNKLHINHYLVQLWGDDYKATGITIPGYPGIIAGGSEDVFWCITALPGNDAVVGQQWSVDLIPDRQKKAGPVSRGGAFKFKQSDGTTKKVSLERERVRLKYFNPETGETEFVSDFMYYVPAETPGLGYTRYPVIPRVDEDAGFAWPPRPGKKIRFEQGSFTVGGSMWGVMLGLGKANNAAGDLDPVFDAGLMTFGFGVNLMICDRGGNLRYLYSARTPVPGSGVAPANYRSELDGSQWDQRPTGFYPPLDLGGANVESYLPFMQAGPAFGAPIAVGGEAWLNCNVTPDVVEPTRTITLTSYPDYLVKQTPFSSFRQERAEKIFRTDRLALGIPITTVDNEAGGADVRDQWSHMMWPFFQMVATNIPGGLNADATLMVAWMNQYRDHDENDTANPAYDFEAHVFSQVTVYATQVRSLYLNYLAAHPGGDPLLDQSFGFDALHPLYATPANYTFVNYATNYAMMKQALETVAADWKLGTGATGLVNEPMLGVLSPGITGDPWGDARYSTAIAPAWTPHIAGTNVTRWGHVNFTRQTPHSLDAPKRFTLLQIGIDPLDMIKGYWYLGLDPPSVSSLPFPRLDIAYFNTQQVTAWPIGGVEHSLFHARNLPLFDPYLPNTYEQATYDYDADNNGVADGKLMWDPHSTGSHTIVSVAFPSSGPAEVRYLASKGSTEITKPDLFGDGVLGYQDRFAPSAAFAAGIYATLETDETLLGVAEHTF